MPDLQNLLDQIDRLDQEASSAPWNTSQHWAEVASGPDSVIHGYYDGECPACAEKINDAASVAISREDLELIVLARTVLPQLAKALQAVMGMHRPLADGSCDTCEGAWRYPCPTVQAITDTLGDSDA